MNIKNITNLSQKERELVESIFSFKDFNLSNLAEFEKSIDIWIKNKKDKITQKQEEILNNIREKLNFFDEKFVLFNTKYIKIDQIATITNKNHINISLQKKSEYKLFWKIDCKDIDLIKENDNIAISFSYNNVYYTFITKVLSKNLLSNSCIFTTNHSTLSYKLYQRKEPRVEVDLNAKLYYQTKDKHKSLLNDCKIVDINSSGAKLSTLDRYLDIKDNSIATLLVLFDNEYLKATVNIRYILKKEDKHFIGLKFIKLEKDFQRKVEAIINRYIN